MRCSGCFWIYEEGEVCPKCGQKREADVAEPFYLLAGTMLQKERYLVGNVVGAGGFGITYAAWDNLLNRKVAIKEYLPGEFSTRLQNTNKITVYGGEKIEQFESGLEKFYEESLKLAKFNEVPGIVQIYDCFRENGTAYIVMEFLEGETLGERLKREEKMPVEEAVQIVTQVLDALEVVHKTGIIHRDIAPNNIYLCSNGDVKILDFGAARSATGTHSKSLTVLYKEGYTAEEQYRSRGEQGPWTDVYALAATLYKMITGVVPDGAMERRRKDRLKAPRKLGVRVPANVEKAILNALNIDIKKRTQSALQFKEELLGEKRVTNRFKRTQEKRVARIPVGLMVIIIVATLGIGTLIALFYTGVITFDFGAFANYLLGDGKARIITVVNMEEEEAREKLAEIGLELEVVDLKYSNDVQEGIIISQQEEKGEVVAQGSVVHVVVSKGAEIVDVPDMIGTKWEDSKVLLDELCLEREEKTIAINEAPGYVVRQTPLGGTQLEQGQMVSVEVSKGMGYDTSLENIMPNLQGKKFIEAKEELAQIGVYLLIKDYEYSDDIPKDCIIGQDIAEGTIVHGEDVVIVQGSLGLEQREVPHVVGKPRDEVTILLQDLNLEPIYTEVLSAEHETGIILSQSIEAGSFVDKFSQIEIEVAIAGFVVPNFVGMTTDAVISECQSRGLRYRVDEVLDGNGTAKSQQPSANSLVEQGTMVVINIGIPKDEFSQKVVDLINSKRAEAGLSGLVINSDWNQAAQTLADTGKQSVEFKNGYSYSWVIPQRSYYTFWGTRENITTIASVESKLPFTETACLNTTVNTIGIGYYGNRICFLLAASY